MTDHRLATMSEVIAAPHKPKTLSGGRNGHELHRLAEPPPVG